MKKNNLLIKLLTLLIIIAAVLPVFYMPAYAWKKSMEHKIYLIMG